MIKTILIDWHGVIDRKTFEKFIQMVSEETGEDFLICRDKIKKLAGNWTLGEIDPKEFWEKFGNLFILSNDQVREFKSYILGIDIDEGVVNFIKGIKSKYQIILFSDCPKDKAEVIKSSDWTKLFDEMIFSYQESNSKDNPKFFTSVLEKINLLPKECLYIDDSGKHIDTARLLGIKTCLFKDVNSLRSNHYLGL